MVLPERFSELPAYAFPRLRTLLDGIEPGNTPVDMTIGEPKHAFPAWVTEVIAEHAQGFGRYPPNDGTPGLRKAQSDWLHRRYGVSVDPATQVLPLNGTREGLYNACMALCPEHKAGKQPIVLIPNPFYQCYMVAALSVGAQPVYVPATAATGHLPDFAGLPEDVLSRTSVAYICSPANPQGAVADKDCWSDLLDLAERYDFKVFADECYAEIYRDTPPPGALEVAASKGTDPERVLVFHSLSKRSNLPGLRSGFVAGGPESVRQLKQLRTYAGAPLPLPMQHAAERVWTDEAHVAENRALYAAKYASADRIFAGVQAYQSPEAGFFLWLPVDDGEAATLSLWQDTGVKVLPGAYLSQTVDGQNPGQGFVRVAMVAEKQEMDRGLILLRDRLYG